jgi:hypothetical protein
MFVGSIRVCFGSLPSFSVSLLQISKMKNVKHSESSDSNLGEPKSLGPLLNEKPIFLVEQSPPWNRGFC